MRPILVGIDGGGGGNKLRQRNTKSSCVCVCVRKQKIQVECRTHLKNVSHCAFRALPTMFLHSSINYTRENGFTNGRKPFYKPADDLTGVRGLDESSRKDLGRAFFSFRLVGRGLITLSMSFISFNCFFLRYSCLMKSLRDLSSSFFCRSSSAFTLCGVQGTKLSH